MAAEDGFAPGIKVIIKFFGSIFKFQFQERSALEAFENLDATDETKKELLGYVTRAQVSEKTFSSLGGYIVVPDQDNRKLILNQAIVKDSEKLFICQKCDDLTSISNAKDFKPNEVGKCIHSKLSSVLYANMEITDLDKTKNTIDVLKEGKETIALVFPSNDHKRPGVIHLTSRTKGVRCVTCSGQKCVHTMIYSEEAHQSRAVGKMRERQKGKVNSQSTTEVIGSSELPLDVRALGIENNSKNDLNPFDHTGKKSNVFGITINYPPNEDEKGEIKRINSEDIFPEKMAFPTLDHNEQCEHGNMFSPELKPGNIETTNMVIHHTSKDPRRSSLTLMFLGTEGSNCDCRKYFTGELTIEMSINNDDITFQVKANTW